MLRLIALLVLSHTSITHAQVSDRDEEARGLYLAGQAAYDAARYADAVERFQESYSLSGRPELLFNIGHASQLDGQLARAVTAFERYLEAAPDGDKREEVAERLQSLQARLEAEEDNAPVTAVEHAAPETQEEPSHVLALTLGLTGAAVAAGGGVFVGLMASQQSAVQDADAGSLWSDVEANHDRARRYRAVGISLLSAGAVLAGAGLSLWLARRQTRVTVHSQGLSVSGSF